MARSHPPDQAAFRSILPEDIDWQPFPAFPPAARPILVGHPSEPGPCVIRVKVPAGTKLMPHKHPEDRIYTVMSGVFSIGLGEAFDGDQGECLSAGQCHRPTGRNLALPLGEGRRIRDASDGDRSAWT
jgi:hypothetical protein